MTIFATTVDFKKLEETINAARIMDGIGKNDLRDQILKVLIVDMETFLKERATA